MKKQNIALMLSFLIAMTSISVAETPAPLPLPEGTPDEVEGYYSRALYDSYRHSINKDIEEASKQSLDRIRTGFSFGTIANKLRKNGASFRYYPKMQTREGETALGQIYHSCDRKENCDWVMKVVTVPIINTVDWAYNNFDAATAATNLKARGDIEPDDSLYGLGFLMKLPSPKPYILANAKKQLYFGKECPTFVNILGSHDYGQERARHLLNISIADEKSPTPQHVKNMVFEVSVVENAEALKIYYSQPIIELTFSGDPGNEIGNKLFESIKGCPNRADAED